jgi:hypothetical protein
MYIYRMKRIVLIVLILISAFKVLSWSAKGHTIVAAFAKENLRQIDKRILDTVQYFLGKMTFEEASVWMDEIKGDSSYDHLKPVHYVNVEKDATYVKTNEPNVINELELVINILFKKGSREKDQIAFALRKLFHLVGDLHQPLHAGYAEDKGGNEIDVSFNGEATNLHALWDGGIIHFEHITLKSCFDRSDKMDLKEKTASQQINILKWMEESRALLPFVYSFENGKINSDYSSKAKPIIEKQLVKAGIRLTAVLFKAFK